MSTNSEEHIRDYANRMAPFSQRQLPVFSHVGKGLKGDSSIIQINTDDYLFPTIECLYNDVLNETQRLAWSMSMTSLIPRIYYEMYQGVREIDGVNYVGYYIKYSCGTKINDEFAYKFWEFDTPFTIMYPFNGSQIPADYIIDKTDEQMISDDIEDLEESMQTIREAITELSNKITDITDSLGTLGTIVEDIQTEDTPRTIIPNETNTNINSITLSSGIWIVIGTINWAGTTGEGIRTIKLSTSPNDTSNVISTNTSPHSQSPSHTSSSTILNIEEQTEVYLIGYQSSGDELGARGLIRATKVSA